MSTPEDPYSSPPGDAQPQPPVQPAAPEYGQPATPGYGQPSYGQPPAAPAYGQPVYGQTSYSQATPATGTNGLAIASLVCSLAGLVTCISAPVGAVLGFVALSQIKKNPQEGRGLALAGAWIGTILTVLGLIGIAVVLAFAVWFANDVDDACTRSDYATDQAYEQCVNRQFDDRFGVDTTSMADVNSVGRVSSVNY